MRALLLPFGSLRDVRPLVTLGATLRARGHDVVLAADPRFSGLAEAAGLELGPLGTAEEYSAVLENPDLWHPRNGPRLLHNDTFGPDLRRQSRPVEVFVTRGQELGFAVPSSLLGADYVPFAQLFPKAAMLVHHGSSGTVTLGLAAGCRQLLTPFGFDQPDNAYRLEQLGVGHMLMAKALNGPKLAA